MFFKPWRGYQPSNRPTKMIKNKEMSNTMSATYLNIHLTILIRSLVLSTYILPKIFFGNTLKWSLTWLFLTEVYVNQFSWHLEFLLKSGWLQYYTCSLWRYRFFKKIDKNDVPRSIHWNISHQPFLHTYLIIIWVIIVVKWKKENFEEAL